MQQGKTIQEFNVGDQATFTKTISEHDVYTFAGITGDFNPMHVNAEYAKNSQFGQRIAHGILSVGFISTVGATYIPGPGAIYISQTCKFLKPVYIGDTITANVEVIKIEEAKNRLTSRTFCTNQRGEIVLDGESVVMPWKA